MLTLEEKLQKLKEDSNKSTKSNDNSPTPLWVFLCLYEKIERRRGEYNIRNIKLIYNWLSPIEIPELTTPVIAPDMFKGYKTRVIADMLADRPVTSSPRSYEIENILIHTIIDMYKRDIL